WRAGRRSRPTSRRWRSASARRRPTTGTIASPSSASRSSVGASCAVTACWTALAACAWAVRSSRRDVAACWPRGAPPPRPPIPGLADVPYWTNRDAVKAEKAPASLVVLGGGAVGAEMTQVFARFGSRVTLVEAEDRILPMEEREASEVVTKVMRDEGIEVRVGRKAVRVTMEGNVIAAHLDDGSRAQGERLRVATGRRPNLAGLGLGTVGLDDRAHSVKVDGRMRAAEKLWAIGDITGCGLFTHVAVYQARILIADILGREVTPGEYRALAGVTF